MKKKMEHFFNLLSLKMQGYVNFTFVFSEITMSIFGYTLNFTCNSLVGVTAEKLFVYLIHYDKFF